MSDRLLNRMDIWGVVVAAGRGVRFGAPKHATRLAGRPLWQWARDALLESGARGVVVVGDVPGGVEGGSERHLSVARGIEELDPEATVIAVHDAARPLASPALMKRMYRVLAESGADGVVPVLPVADALKRVDADGDRIVDTIDRQGVACAQTPQVFRADVLRRAHAHHAEGAPPDDASMVEALGGRVMAVAGERSAMKVTYPEDLMLAEAFLRHRSRLGEP
ncbi:MAG: IspD/TarI family cytidylyltransferase [bacterium]|nr:IspD/TarI family cytidylyltransferase [bacterium]